MAKIIKIIEGDSYKRFYPLTLNHASFEIRVGNKTLLDLILQDIEDLELVELVVRDELADIIKERFPNFRVNSRLTESDNLKEYTDLKVSDYIDRVFPGTSNLFSFVGGKGIEVFSEDAFDSSVPDVITINNTSIVISKTAIIRPGCIIDASEGPVIVDDDALLDIGCLIKGPSYIGKGTTVNPGAKLKDVAIGPYCKVGGEIEHSTFLGYSNKQHDGYIGHSYIGEWVNLGANTNNSDLKNNYSSVRVKIFDEEIDTGELFIGCLIGDYTKTAISTMINTGTYIGMGCNIFGEGFHEKYIPNFRWGRNTITEFDKFINTLSIVKSRRDKKLSSSEKKLIKKINKNKN